MSGQAEKLLGAVAADSEFVVPPVSPSESVGADVRGEAETEWTGPWDPLDGSIDIQAEIRALLAEEPGLTLTTLHPRLRARYPHLYKRREEALAMNGPLDGLKTGVYEEGYKLYVEPIGSTSAEE